MKKLLIISGSLRKDSFNSALARSSMELSPENTNIDILDLNQIPLFNEDERLKEIPESVKIFSEKISLADGILIITPEYNYSIPGVLKNAIDWVSKMPEQPFNKKPTAIMGATTGMLGTVRAQLHLREVLFALNANLINSPEVYINFVKDKFDSNGKLVDIKTKEKIKSLLLALCEKVEK